jgi:hypothetical protein
MSGESVRHVRLVEKLIQNVEAHHQSPRGLMVFADHHRFGGNRPPRIGGFTPDLYAHDLPATFRVVGEAKTPDDLISDRSSMQLRAFLDHLALHPGGVLYLAVPFFSVARANLVLHTIRTAEHASVTIRVVHGT